jgi:peptidoglycan/xylan/chitin deacetylase (PgdA/CDA1 family)
MRFLSPILHRAIYPVLGSAGYFHFRPVAPITVITYHGVLPNGYENEDAFLNNTLVTEKQFRSQLRLLKRHYRVISPDEFVSWLRTGQDLPEKAILLTCDDGLLNHLRVMLPILQEEGLKCLFFVTGSSAGDARQLLWYVELYLLLMQVPVWEQPIRLQGVLLPAIETDLGRRRAVWLALLKSLSRVDSDRRRRFLSEAAETFGLPASWTLRYLDEPLLRDRFPVLRLQELKQLADTGMTIGAHTLSHPVLAQQSPDMAHVEIAECRKRLEGALGRQVWAIAYPFGDPGSVGAREFKLAEEAGYECGFVNVGGVLDAPSARFALPRVHVTAEMSLSVYEAYISGVHDALRRRLRPNGRGG